MSDLTRKIATVLGPTLVAVTTSETVNLDIWEGVHPALVYLNGLIFLVAGLFIVTTHHSWQTWDVALVTISGWLLTAAGLFRMFLPSAPRAAASPATYTMIAALCLLGLVLSWIGFAKKS